MPEDTKAENKLTEVESLLDPEKTLLPVAYHRVGFHKKLKTLHGVKEPFTLEIAHPEAADPWYLGGWGPTVSKTTLLLNGMSDGAPVLVVAVNRGDLVIHCPTRNLEMIEEEIELTNPYGRSLTGFENIKTLRFKCCRGWDSHCD